jgi:hypothetical protein
VIGAPEVGIAVTDPLYGRVWNTSWVVVQHPTVSVTGTIGALQNLLHTQFLGGPPSATILSGTWTPSSRPNVADYMIRLDGATAWMEFEGPPGATIAPEQMPPGVSCNTVNAFTFQCTSLSPLTGTVLGSISYPGPTNFHLKVSADGGVNFFTLSPILPTAPTISMAGWGPGSQTGTANYRFTISGGATTVFWLQGPTGGTIASAPGGAPTGTTCTNTSYNVVKCISVTPLTSVIGKLYYPGPTGFTLEGSLDNTNWTTFPVLPSL